MDDSERLVVVARLLAVLEEAGLGWIAREVELEFETGREMIRSLPDQPDGDFLVPARAYGESIPKSEPITTSPYNPYDQIVLIIEAIDRVVRDAVDLETGIYGSAPFIAPSNEFRLTYFALVPGDHESRVVAPVRTVSRPDDNRHLAVEGVLRLTRELREHVS